MDLSRVEDMKLLIGIGQNDTPYFNELFNRYWEPLYLFAYNSLKTKEEAKDVVQEFFIKLWARRTSLQITENVRAYLFTAVRYEILKKISSLSRDGKKRTQWAMILDSFALFVDPFSVQELQAEIAEHLQSLPPRSREIFQLSRDQQLSTKEIAMHLKLSEQTVKNQLTHSLKSLRKLLKQTLLWGIIFLTIR